MKKSVLVILFSVLLIGGVSQDLVRYSSVVDRIDFKVFEKGKQYDAEGIIKSKNKYHPLDVAKAGLMCYYLFLETKDSTYFDKCLNQIKYFRDTSKVDLKFDGKGLGLPYRYKFWDLKSPWYSGMTQGMSISFLLRFYQLTKDESLLQIVEKLAYFMRQPQEEGGTVSVTSKGCKFIEEYPNSKSAPQVLNGYFNGLIGLKEYCDFFPKDTAAYNLYLETFDCCKTMLEFFDTANWSYYNLKKKSIGKNYIRYQIYEVDQIYKMTKDPIFDHQKRIWSVMALNKFAKDPKGIFLRGRHNISVPILDTIGEYSKLKFTKKQQVVDGITIKYLNSKRHFRKWKKGKLIPEDYRETKFQVLTFEVDSSRNSNYFELTFSEDITDLDIMLKSTLDNYSNLDEGFYVKHLSGNKLYLTLKVLTIKEIALTLQSKTKIPNIVDSKWVNTIGELPPFYIHKKSPITFLEKQKSYYLGAATINSNRSVIFYRSGLNEAEVSKKKWMARKTTSRTFIPESEGFYQFMIVSDYNSPLSMINKFVISNDL